LVLEELGEMPVLLSAFLAAGYARLLHPLLLVDEGGRARLPLLPSRVGQHVASATTAGLVVLHSAEATVSAAITGTRPQICRQHRGEVADSVASYHRFELSRALRGETERSNHKVEVQVESTDMHKIYHFHLDGREKILHGFGRAARHGRYRVEIELDEFFFEDLPTSHVILSVSCAALLTPCGMSLTFWRFSWALNALLGPLQ